MANNKKKKMTPVQQQYDLLSKSREPKRPVLANCARAFLVGGLICIVGQAVSDAFIRWGGFNDDNASKPTVAVMIILSVILTCLGVYDKLAQWAGAGSAVPVTGFANSMASTAIEYRSEGLVLGVGGQMFKLAGAVIVYGAVAAFIIGILHWVFKVSF
ncbi:stage V sporulation protein AC [Paenibacillus humicola]|uniref:stage V sporulation protein AC n=1 Tax=Paenibacillus humicola TaxID=3110540 RepID=UPI00237B20C1|nr:stage V sporulation protein AC [Paenibacillus humicola]